MTIQITLLLAAIASVESGGNPLAVGKAGERSQFQISAATWNQHAHDPGVLPGDFERDASDPVIAESRATGVIVFYAKELEKAGLPVTIENLAGAWNFGITGQIARYRRAARISDYVTRVSAIYADSLAKQPSRVPLHLQLP